MEKYIRTEYETEYRNWSLGNKLGSNLMMIGNASRFYLSTIPKLSFYKSRECVVFDKNSYNLPSQQPIKNNKGLFVILHGLMGSPKICGINYLQYIKKEYPEYEIYVPYVPNKGNCKFEDAAEPILNLVLDYTNQNPGNSINLIGISNGARIAAYIDIKLRHLNVNVRLTGIAGVFFGSSTMSTLSNLHLAQLIIHPEVVSELQAGSEWCKNLISELQFPCGCGSRSYEFYATVNDYYIPNFSSCFPSIPNAKYNLKSGQDHLSLAQSIMEEVVKKGIEWSNENNF